MPDYQKDFHQFALQSALFKGQPDRYFCFLKAERLAYVLGYLAEQTGSDTIRATAQEASELPSAICYLTAQETDSAALLADCFSLLSSVRMLGAHGVLPPEAVAVLVQETEYLLRRLSGTIHRSPFVRVEDLSVPFLDTHTEPTVSHTPTAQKLPTEHKQVRQDRPTGAVSATQTTPSTPKVSFISQQSHTQISHNVLDNKTPSQSPLTDKPQRSVQILEFVRTHKKVSIKDIAAIMQDCSEKTIQRELAELVARGLIYKEGERRWSTYQAL